jgi:hypothetical protein
MIDDARPRSSVDRGRSLDEEIPFMWQCHLGGCNQSGVSANREGTILRRNHYLIIVLTNPHDRSATEIENILYVAFSIT